MGRLVKETIRKNDRLSHLAGLMEGERSPDRRRADSQSALQPVKQLTPEADCVL
jgi:hypothetical protein